MCQLPEPFITGCKNFLAVAARQYTPQVVHPRCQLDRLTGFSEYSSVFANRPEVTWSSALQPRSEKIILPVGRPSATYLRRRVIPAGEHLVKACAVRLSLPYWAGTRVSRIRTEPHASAVK